MISIGSEHEKAQSPGMIVNAVIPEPRIDETPRLCAAASASPLTAIPPLMVDTTFTTISGAAAPSAMNDAPATSSGTRQRATSTSSPTAK